MISRAIVSAFPDVPQGMHMFPAASEDHMLFPHSVEAPSSSSSSSQFTSLLFNLSVLKDKLTQMQTLAGVLISQGHGHGHGHGQGQTLPDPTCSAIASMNSIIQEFIVTASSMMLTCQHMLLNFSPLPPGTTTTTTATTCTDDRYCNSHTNNIARDKGQCTTTVFSCSDQNLDWFGGESYDNNNINHYTDNNNNLKEENPSVEISETNDNNKKKSTDEEPDIIEVDAADLLAKYTHYCQICGKGFKRDANLRMHMRAHGDEYKTSAALSNPVKNMNMMISGGGKEGLMVMSTRPKKYSCPQEGCRWNKKHARFQPLKSMICVKNHYKRSHCPKMYVCKRCNLKQFSVLSDLRTHEKHCGDLKWQCSCGTTFSRKDKLMGHVALFVGHAPSLTPSLSSSLENC